MHRLDSDTAAIINDICEIIVATFVPVIRIERAACAVGKEQHETHSQSVAAMLCGASMMIDVS
jgi:hypothetical protein